MITLERIPVPESLPEDLEKQVEKNEKEREARDYQKTLGLGSPENRAIDFANAKASVIKFLSERYERVRIPQKYFVQNKEVDKLPKIVSTTVGLGTSTIRVRRKIFLGTTDYTCAIPQIPYEILQEYGALKSELDVVIGTVALSKVITPIITSEPDWKRAQPDVDPVLSIRVEFNQEVYDFLIAQWGEDGENVAKKLRKNLTEKAK